MFRSPSGLQCAVGCLIPKDMYKRGLENVGPDSFVKGIPLEFNGLAFKIGKKVGLQKVHLQLLLDLQGVHDDEEVKDWRNVLRFVARKHRLNQKVL